MLINRFGAGVQNTSDLFNSALGGGSSPPEEGSDYLHLIKNCTSLEIHKVVNK